MAKLTTYALAGALAIALAPTMGRAADLPEPPLLEPIEPVEFGSAWYLRGDVGYKFYRDPSARFLDPAYKGVDKYRKENLDEAFIFGGGVGYKFNEWFRTDVTVDYETKADFGGKLWCIGCATKGLYSDERAKISALTFLANAYFDIGTWHGFTPYVGAGIGTSRVNVDDYRYTNPNGSKGKIGGDHKWNLAWALMAGVGYEVSDNITIDANYRYVDLGEGRTKRVAGVTGGHRVKIDDIAAHEIRLGVRYTLD
ncbi:outer surface protein [Methylopila jiangsuensis]|uniref:Outer surface protein n=1 Tax=Methylopila jiangsuensis TaxID=586230 RepID=A0A9W6JIQ5_9HYPH|nr:outer membrane protein [Methylopila jiangsuensis]MDR6284230.1 opacity protein-like surface antigen [Methylopila jiangsuensis]GLK76253.1 outer surface protein [Methylopila jiangsuensis]